MDSLLSAAQSRSLTGQLEALRDRLAAEIDACESARDLAALSRQYVDVTTRLDDLSADSKQEGTVLDELAKRRAAGGNLR